MIVAGWIASALIGVSLGLIGGGGSILTLPVLVYLFGITPVTAISYSMFVVGSSSAIGAFQKWKAGQVVLPVVLAFGLPSLITVFLFRRYVMPAIPEVIVHIGRFAVTRDLLVLALFGLLMVFAAVSMLRPAKATTQSEKTEYQPLRLVLQGIAVGIVSGVLGAGGGFIIIPSLMLFARLNIRNAIGTSLTIIAINAGIGFLGDMGHLAISWGVLLPITALAVLGIFIGGILSKYISATALKKGFGWFVLAMGLYIIVKEVFL